jgi:acyl dehydratase
MERAVDVSQCSIGDTIEVPYEITVSEAWMTLWQSCFYQHDRLYTSVPFAKSLGFQTHPLPFALLLFKTVSMSHVDSTKEVLDLGFDNAVYHRPVYPGQTFRKQYSIKGLRTTTDSKGTVATIRCELYNTDHEVVFSVDKQMLFYGQVNEFNKGERPSYKDKIPESLFLKYLLEQADRLPINSHLAAVEPGQLILHDYSKCLGRSMTASLTCLNRMTHPMLYDTHRWKESEIVVSRLGLIYDNGCRLD